VFGQRDLSRSKPRTASDRKARFAALQWEWVAAGIGGVCLFGAMIVLNLMPQRMAGAWAPILFAVGGLLALPAYWTAQWKRADWNLRATHSDDEARERTRRARILESDLGNRG
jgi:hypothetical protein